MWQVRETSSSGESGGQVVLLELLLLAPLVSQHSGLQAANLRTLRATLNTSSATTHAPRTLGKR